MWLCQRKMKIFDSYYEQDSETILYQTDPVSKKQNQSQNFISKIRKVKKSVDEKVSTIRRHEFDTIQVFHAVQNGCLDYLKRNNNGWLKKYITKRNPNNQYTLLHEAASSNQVEVLEYLLSLNNKVNIQAVKKLTPLHVAVKSNNVECVKLLTACKSLKLDLQDSKGQTALDLACRNNYIEIAETLLGVGANPNKREYDNVSCLHNAIRTGNLKLIKLLLSHGARLDVKDNNGLTPLHVAAADHSSDTFLLCLETIKFTKNTVPFLIDVQDNEGYTCLLTAVRYGNPSILDICIELGSNITISQCKGRSSVHLAVEEGYTNILKRIIELEVSLIDQPDLDLNTPLHLAIGKGNLEIARLLIAKGVRINACNKKFQTPIMMAALRCSTYSKTVSTQIFDLLLSNGANVNVKDKKRQNILHILVRQLQFNEIKLIFEKTSKRNILKMLNSSNYEGNMPLHIASEVGSLQICEFLISHGALTLPLTADDNIPALVAIKNGYLDILKLFLDTDVHQTYHRMEDECNLIMSAAEYNRLDILKYMIDRKVDMYARDESGNNVLMYACRNGNIEMVEMLLSQHFSVATRNIVQNSPLHESAENGHWQLVEYLLNQGCELNENLHGQTPITLALERKYWKVVWVFFNEKNWRKSMDFRFRDGKRHLESLILYNAEICKDILNRGVTVVEDGANQSHSFIKYDLSLLDAGPYDSESVRYRYNGLMTMANCRNHELLNHPLSRMLYQRRWKRYGAVYRFIDLFLYMVYLVSLTIYVVQKAPANYPSSSFVKENCIDFGISNITSIKPTDQPTVTFMLYAILIIRIVFELFKILTQGLTYFTIVTNYSFLFLYSLHVMFIYNPFSDTCEIKWGFGATLILLAWISLFEYQKSLPKSGVLVLMLDESLTSVFKIMLLFSNVIVGFSLAFYALNRSEDQFKTVELSILKSFDMMIGEIEYTRYFSNAPNAISYFKRILSIMFMLVVCVGLMNLMVGVAVGDIARMMEEASLNIKITAIRFTDNTESMMPRFVQDLFYEPSYIQKLKVTKKKDIDTLKSASVVEQQSNESELKQLIVSMATKLENLEKQLAK